MKMFFNYDIDMSTFDQKEFDNVKSCKYCNHNFQKDLTEDK